MCSQPFHPVTDRNIPRHFSLTFGIATNVDQTLVLIKTPFNRSLLDYKHHGLLIPVCFLFTNNYTKVKFARAKA